MKKQKHKGPLTVIDVSTGRGQEAMDWMTLLTTMYFRWAQKNGFMVSCRELKFRRGWNRCRVEIVGDLAKRIKHEAGVHWLVRVSPFDPEKRRHTSFAVVEIGHQQRSPAKDHIRSYVLHPYKLVSDKRTGVETDMVYEVLDGAIDKFLD